MLSSASRSMPTSPWRMPASVQDAVRPAKDHRMKGEDILKAMIVGSLILLGQHLLADEEASWLRRLGLWPPT